MTTVWLFAYQLVLIMVFPLVRLRLWLRGRKEPGYRERVAERFGRVPSNIRPGALWIHAVSAGETIAATPLIERLISANPDLPVLVTTMTPTGSGEVRRRLGDRVMHCYAPYDFPWAVRAFLAATRPRALVLVETELWPNLVLGSRRRDIPVALVNARLSERSARGYSRIRPLVAKLLQSMTLIACQSEAHQRRFLALGARANSLAVLGSVKFDLQLDAPIRQAATALRARWGLRDRPVLIAASTHPGEEEPVLEAFAILRKTQPGLCLVLVPRHPVRAPELVTMVRLQGLGVALQSELEGMAPDVVIGDVMGSLLMLYGAADVAFVGGSLVPQGGHNPIEAAVWGKPVLMGPQVFNFQAVVEGFRDVGALVEVQDAGSLAAAVGRLLSDPVGAAALGARGEAVVAAGAGALDRTLNALARALSLRAE